VASLNEKEPALTEQASVVQLLWQWKMFLFTSLIISHSHMPMSFQWGKHCFFSNYNYKHL